MALSARGALADTNAFHQEWNIFRLLSTGKMFPAPLCGVESWRPAYMELQRHVA